MGIMLKSLRVLKGRGTVGHILKGRPIELIALSARSISLYDTFKFILIETHEIAMTITKVFLSLYSKENQSLFVDHARKTSA